MLVKTRSYCSGDRHRLYESGTLGLETLTKCAELALSDERCDGTGYFDTAVRGEAYQCKCPGGGACLTNTGYESNWSIYFANYSGKYLLYLTIDSLEERILWKNTIIYAYGYIQF